MCSYYSKNIDFFNKYIDFFVYVADPGAFSVLKLFAGFLENQGKTIHYILDGWALQQQSKTHALSKWMGVEDFINNDHPRCALLYGAQRSFPLNYAMVAHCRENKIGTLFVFDHWKNHLINFFDEKNNKLFLPDKIAVIDEMQKKEVMRDLSPFVPNSFLEHIDIIGHPAVDNSLAIIKELSFHELNTLQQEYNPCDKELTLLVLEPIELDFGKDRFLGYDEYSFLKYFFQNHYMNKMHVLVKPHPRNDISTIANFLRIHLSNENIDYSVVMDEKIENLIAISDLIYGMTSIALITSIFAGKNVTSLQPNRNTFGKTLSNPHLEQTLALC